MTVAGDGVQSDEAVVHAVGVEGLPEAGGSPGWGIVRRGGLGGETNESGFAVAGGQGPQENEDRVAHEGREGGGVACDVTGGFLRAGRADFGGLGGLVVRIAQALPLFHQAGIYLCNQRAEKLLHFADDLVLGGVGDCLGENLVDTAEMT